MTFRGYSFITPVCEVGDLILYQATRVADGLPVLLKFPVTARPPSALLHRLEHEYELARDLDPSRIARPIALERDGGKMALTLEPGPTKTLASLLDSPMDVASFLQIAIGISAALAELHRHELVHKDLKPEHVLMDATGHVWLTGLGIASRLPREHQAPEPPDLIAGTLAYMAPEQTGRMNRSIDSRSDLYALGVNFYQMLTGVLPFSANDPMEWVHCHIARQPVPPSQRVPNLPELLSEIVMKLLAKTAEERYQTVGGLQADLARCLAQLQTNRHIVAFPLGMQDTPDRLLIPEKLYGRETEIRALVAAFDRVVARGTPELMLVSGYSGIGKSSVVNELHKVLVPPRGLFASGKFDQYKRDIPYATLAQALQTLVRQVLGKPEEEVSQWRQAMQEAAGANGQLLVSLIPELGMVIGPQPPVPDLSPQDAQNRFNTVFRRFLDVFARKEHPLALFLDDLQWLDAATLELLKHLLSHPEVKHLFLLGAYRDNEVSPTHPLMVALDAIRQSGARIEEIVLAPLTCEDVSRLVADTVRSEVPRAAPLAQLVHEKTGGNPFFAIQFLTALADEKLLTFNPGRRAWTWNLDRIHAKGYTANVVQLMVGKLSRLPLKTQQSLEHFACLGNVAAIHTLKLVHGSSEETLHSDLWEAVRAGLVFRHELTYTFLHDRVQEAAYALIPRDQRPAAHLLIGRLLVSRTPPQELDEQIFEIAGQLNRGAELITAPAEREQLACLNLRAGTKAKAATAYASACRYLEAAMEVLKDDGWERCYGLTFSIWFERADCELLISNFEVAAQLIEELLRRARSKIDRAEAYRLRMVLQLMHGNNKPAIRTALECLLLFGMELPETPTREEVQAEYDTLWRSLGGRQIGGLVELPLMTDPEVVEVMKILSILWRSAYFIDGNLCQMVACRMVNVSMQHGNCDSSVIGYALLAIFVGPVFQKYQEGDQFARLAVAVAEKHRFTAQKAGANFLMQMAVIWTCPLDVAISCVDAAIHTAQETGEIVYACYSLEHRLTDLIARGDPLDQIWSESVKALDFVLKIKFRHVIDIISSVQPFIQALRGTTGAPPIDEAAVEAQALDGGIAVVICYHWILQLQRHFLLGTPEDALAYAAKVEPILWSARCHIQSVDYYLYSSLAMAALYPAAQPERQASFHETLTSNLEILRRLAESCPATFSHKFAIVAAEIARLESRDMDAMRLYEQALHNAHENRFVQDEAIAYELASAFYRSREFYEFADTYLQQARDAYSRWGAQGKVRQLEERFPQLRPAPSLAPTTTFSAPSQELDLLAVVQASQAISGEILLDNLLQTLMRIVLENAGAQRGHLLLIRNQQLTLAAEARVKKESVVVQIHPSLELPDAMLPASIINYVRRSGDRVLLNDAAAPNPYSADKCFSRRHPKSVLCFPITKQTRLIGLFYLENDLATHAFTLERLAILELLAAQAAIALENALVYEALQESESKYRRIVDTASEGVLVLGPDTLITFVNARMAQILGYPAEDIVGRLLTDFTFEEDLPDHLKRMEHRRHGQPENYERRFHRKDGETVWTFASATPIFDDKHQFQGSFAMLTDITERKKAEKELKQAKETAEAANQAKDQFIAVLSHELRTPLTPALLTVGDLQMREDLPPHLRPDVDLIRQSIEMQAALIDDLLDVTRIGRGEIKLQPEALDVRDCMKMAFDVCQKEIEKKRLEVRSEFHAAQHHVWGDPTRMRQVFWNLLKNAIKFTPEGGQIVVRTLNVGDRLQIEMTDTGIGIDPKIMPRIFNPFEQGERSRTRQFGGLGLGLYIARAIVELHRGRLTVFSKGTGKGATFTVELATVAPQEKPCTPAPSPEPETRRSLRILVVEDHAETMYLLTKLLQKWGHAVAAAESVKKARELAAQREFDLVISDMGLPDGSGLDVIRYIKEISGIPGIALSGFGTEEDILLSKAAGFATHLVKPINATALRAAIEKFASPKDFCDCV